ncbi:MAG: ABC transporter substrate-binding protein [Actinomycetaceae bacterium]|nr:ABC transporter substrate-binding protein [Actinomycetaceae bacterium]
MKKKRILTGFFAGAAALSLALTGCSGAGNDDASNSDVKKASKEDVQKKKSDEIIVAYGTEPQRPLVPGDTNETGGGDVIDVLWEGLVYYDEEGKSHNGVAEDISSEDNKKWTVKLKKDRKFSDGTPVKAENFVKAWQATTKQALLNQWWFGTFEGVDEEGNGDLSGVKVVDDFTFEVNLKEPESTFPLQLGYSAFYPLPDVAFDGDKLKADFGKAPVTNGPYKFDEWKNNQYIKTVRNDKYVGDREALNGGVEFKIYQQDNAGYADLQSGTLDVMKTIPAASLNSFKSDLGERAIQQEQAVHQTFTIAAKEPHFEIGTEEGKLRRQAISMAIDRDTISEKIFAGVVKPAKGWFNPTINYYNDKVKGVENVEFNPDKARELWKKAEEISKFEGDFTLAYNADASHKEWVDAVCNSIKKELGVNAHGNGVPTFKDFRDQVTNREMKGAFRTGWQADYPSPVNYYGSIYVTGGSANDGDYTNKKFDDLVQKIRTSKDDKEIQKFSDEAAEILFDDLPSIPLWTTQATGGHSERTSNVIFDWHGVPMYYQVVVEKK